MDNKYKSSELFMKLLHSEYTFEDERMKIIDSKAGILIAVVAVLLPLSINSINDELLNKQYGISFWLISCSIIIGFLCLISTIISIYVYKYDRLSPTILANEGLSRMDKGDAARAVSVAIQIKLEKKRRSNNVKLCFYRIGIILLAISLGLLCASMIVNKIIHKSEEDIVVCENVKQTSVKEDSNERIPSVTEAITMLSETHIVCCSLEPKKGTTPSTSPAASPSVPPEAKEATIDPVVNESDN